MDSSIRIGIFGRDEKDLEVFRQVLSDCYNCSFFSDPQGMATYMALQSPDLLILTANGHEGFGVTLLEEARQFQDKDTLPVLMTVNDFGGDIVKECLDHGANDFLKYPYDPQLILSRVRSQLFIIKHLKAKEELKKIEEKLYLVVTHNHEINSPLSIVNFYLDEEKIESNEVNYHKIKTAVKDITSRVKLIRELSDDVPSLRINERLDR